MYEGYILHKSGFVNGRSGKRMKRNERHGVPKSSNGSCPVVPSLKYPTDMHTSPSYIIQRVPIDLDVRVTVVDPWYVL